MNDSRPTDRLAPDAPKVPSLTGTVSDGKSLLSDKLAAPGGGTGLSTLDILRNNKLLNGAGLKPADTTAKPADTAVKATDTTKTTDKSAAPTDKVLREAVDGVLTVDFGEKDFDKIIAQKNYHTLRIKGLPKDVEPRSWMDDKGIYFWFKKVPNGASPDDKAPHYFPSNCQKILIDIWDGKQYKPYEKLADELRVSAVQAYLQEQNKVGFASYTNATNPLKYVERMAQISAKALELEEKLLREAAAGSPHNPYFRIYLADVLTAQAAKPIAEAIAQGKPVKWDNPETLKKIDEALVLLQEARTITKRFGDIRVVNEQMQPPLSPFGLNRYSYNPDFYWSGAAFQAYRRETGLSWMKGLIKTGVLNNFELP